MKFIPGYESKASLKARGLDFETIISEIERNGILLTYTNPKYPGQMVVVAKVAGYTHCMPCEQMGDDVWRIITAWPSRRHERRL